MGQCGPGEQCSTGADCASYDCLTMFSDADGDGFGNGASATGRCDGVGAGVVGNGSDCCDSDAYAFPGQTQYFQAPSNCGDHNYDCNGLTDVIFWDTSNGQPTGDPRPLRVYCDTATCVGFNYQCYWAGSFEQCGDIYSYDIVIENGCYFFGLQQTSTVLMCR